MLHFLHFYCQWAKNNEDPVVTHLKAIYKGECRKNESTISKHCFTEIAIIKTINLFLLANIPGNISRLRTYLKSSIQLCVSEITERYFTPGLFNLENDIQPELVEIDTYPFPENIHKEGSAESSTSTALNIYITKGYENCFGRRKKNSYFMEHET